MASLLRIQSVSRVMAWFCWLPIVMILLVLLFGVQEEHAAINIEKKTSSDGTISYHYDYSGGEIHFSTDGDEETTRSTGDVVLALLRSFPSLALLIGFLHIRKLFRTYSSGEFFTVAAARHLKWFSLSLIAFGILRPLGILDKDIFERFAEADALQYTWEFPDFGISVFFLGLLLLVISWVMGEAARLAEYNKSIV